MIYFSSQNQISCKDFTTGKKTTMIFNLKIQDIYKSMMLYIIKKVGILETKYQQRRLRNVIYRYLNNYSAGMPHNW